MIQWIRNALRLFLGVSFFLALLFAGYFWSLPGQQIFAMLAGLAAIVAVIAFESMAWRRENQVKRLHEQLAEDEQDFVQWKEKVRLLGGVVNILWQDNAELRQGHLVGEIELLRRRPPAQPDPSAPKAIEDATSDLLALPNYDNQNPVGSTRQE